MTAGLSVAIEDRGASALIVAEGELDLATAPKFAAALSACSERGRDVLVDLRGLDFMDCSGLRCLFEADACTRRRRRQLVVVADRGAARHLLDVTGAHRRLKVVTPRRGTDGPNRVSRRAA